MGGANATGYQRCSGHTVVATSPVAWARTWASVVASPVSKDWAGLRAATRWPSARSCPRAAAATHVLPTSVPVPTTTTSRAGRSRVIFGSWPGHGHSPFGDGARVAVAGQGVAQLIDLVVGVGRRQRHP